MTDRLYDAVKAAELLGTNANDVRVMIRRGDLKAKALVARGSGERPRLRIEASEIARFIREMKSPAEVQQEFARRDGRKTRPKNPPKREREKVKNYY